MNIRNNSPTLRAIEKDFAKITKALSNLLSAIEAGIFTETTKQRLQELEAQKHLTEEKLLIEKSKVKETISKSDIEKHLKFALKQKPKNLIDLLLDKVVVFKDKLQITLKYTNQPIDTDNNPDGNTPRRGCLIWKYAVQYEAHKQGRKAHNADSIFVMKDLYVEIYI